LTSVITPDYRHHHHLRFSVRFSMLSTDYNRSSDPHSVECWLKKEISIKDIWRRSTGTSWNYTLTLQMFRNGPEIFCWTEKLYLFIMSVWKQLKTLEKFLFLFKVQFKYSIAVNASNVHLKEIKINIKQWPKTKTWNTTVLLYSSCNCWPFTAYSQLIIFCTCHPPFWWTDRQLCRFDGYFRLKAVIYAVVAKVLESFGTGLACRAFSSY